MAIPRTKDGHCLHVNDFEWIRIISSNGSEWAAMNQWTDVQVSRKRKENPHIQWNAGWFPVDVPWNQWFEWNL